MEQVTTSATAKEDGTGPRWVRKDRQVKEEADDGAPVNIITIGSRQMLRL